MWSGWQDKAVSAYGEREEAEQLCCHHEPAGEGRGALCNYGESKNSAHTNIRTVYHMAQSSCCIWQSLLKCYVHSASGNRKYGVVDNVIVQYPTLGLR